MGTYATTNATIKYRHVYFYESLWVLIQEIHFVFIVKDEKTNFCSMFIVNYRFLCLSAKFGNYVCTT